MPKWIDLSSYNAKLTGILFPDGKQRLVVSGLVPKSPLWDKAIRVLDFYPSTSGKTLLRDNIKISKNDFKRVFMLLKVREFTRAEIIHVVAPKTGQQPSTKKTNTEKKEDNTADQDLQRESVRMRTTKVLGLNHLGDEVFDSENGRFIRSKKESEVFKEDDLKVSASFLRYDDTEEGMRLCAKGFVQSMKAGKNMKSADIITFASTILNKKIDTFSPELRTVQEAVESAINQEIADLSTGANEETFNIATSFYEKQPPFVFKSGNSSKLQQFSTPAPMSVVAQRLLGDTEKKWILEPTIGNASLVTSVSHDAHVLGFDLDDNRVGQAGALTHLGDNLTTLQKDATSVDFESYLKEMTGEEVSQYDCVIANPPFGGLRPAQDFLGLHVTRIDHLIALRSLAARKDNGRAVFIVAADRDNLFPGKEGVISGGSKNFFNWLTDHYEVEDAFEVVGKLYKKQGAGYPIRIITVGEKRNPDDVRKAFKSKEFRLEKLKVINSWDEMWSHADEVCHKLNITTENNDEKISPDEDDEHLIENAFQAPYVSASTINEPTSMIPRNLLGASQVAFSKLESYYSAEGFESIEDFIVAKMNTEGFDVEHLGKVLSAEQIDAVALGIYQAENNRELIVGDQTGLGKGRILAALAIYSINGAKKHSIFLTETKNLFSDFWRDICDVCGDSIDPTAIFKPFIINADADIRDQENKLVFRRTTPATRKEVLGTMVKPIVANGFNIMFATYSQFNRLAESSPKSAWLPIAAEDSFIIKDESHNAAGDSNTAENISAATDHAFAGVSSSATFAKKSQNLLAYYKAFPEGVCDSSLNEIMEVGGEPLQEIMSGMLSEDGVLVRREHDLSQLEFVTHEDTKHLSRNEHYSDILSSILLDMSHLSGDISGIVKGINKARRKELEKIPKAARKGKRMSVSSVNFGSRLYNILRQFMLAVKVDETADLAIKALEEGRKPIIVVEQTMETILKEALFKEYDDDDKTTLNQTIEGTEIPKLTFKDLLLRIIEKLTVVTERNDYGSAEKKSIYSYCENEDEAKALQSYVDSLRDKASEFPDLDISPLDSVRDRIEKAGYSCGEISGRSLYLKIDPNGENINVLPRENDRLKEIYEFNAGEKDAIILTRAGSTGLSLHSSINFEDQRQREIVELQIANDVNSRMQFFGRANRKGQVNAPIIRTLSSGLPSETRILAMQNVKLRKLSANTQSNRENVAEMDEIPDILNNLGNKICMEYLSNNHDVAYKLNIPTDPEEMKQMSTGSVDAAFANMLTGRIALLPVQQQKKIYEDIFEEYQTTIAEMEAKGKNPFKTKVLDINAEIVNRKLYEGCEQSSYLSVFDKPVYCSTLQWTVNVAPIQFGALTAGIKANVDKNKLDPRINLVDGFKSTIDVDLAKNTLLPEGIIDSTRKVFLDYAEKAWEKLQEKEPDKYYSIGEAAQTGNDNDVARINKRAIFLTKALKEVVPGRMLSLTPLDDDGETIRDERMRGVVVGVDYPDAGVGETLFGRYKVKLAVPGEEKPRNLTFNMLLKDYEYETTDRISDEYIPVKEVFNNAPSGEISRYKTILDGNLFRAAQIATDNKLGHAGVFTDKDGVSRRAILLKQTITQEAMDKIPVKITDAAVAAKLLLNHQGSELKTYVVQANTVIGARIERDGWDSFKIMISGTKKTGGKYFSNSGLTNITGEFYGNRTTMKASFPEEKLQDVLHYLLRKINDPLFAPAEYRGEVQKLSLLDSEKDIDKPKS